MQFTSLPWFLHSLPGGVCRNHGNLVSKLGVTLFSSYIVLYYQLKNGKTPFLFQRTVFKRRLIMSEEEIEESSVIRTNNGLMG